MKLSVKTNTPLLVLILLVSASLLLGACSALPGRANGSQTASAAAAEATAAAQPVTPITSRFTVEGNLAPRQSAELGFSTGGRLADVLVKEGEAVKAGQVLARLEGSEQLQAALSTAELEVFTAQQALQKLDDDLPEQQAAALQALKDAREALRDAEQRVSGLGVSSEPIDIQVARSNVALAKRTLDQAKKDFRPYENKPENNLKRAALLSKLSDAQKRYDQAVEQLNRLTGVTVPAFDQQQAQTELEIAQAKLKLAENGYALLQNGPDPDEVELAQRRLKNAQDRAAAARLSLAELELKSPIDGVVVTFSPAAGEPVAPNQVITTIADFSQWVVETDNLTELDVVDIRMGQTASIVADALPEVILTGEVQSISQAFVEKRGDITYTARLRLDNTDPRLRWGMTVAVSFEK